MKGNRIVDTDALIDPGSTGTYNVENIAKAIDEKTVLKFYLNVQFLSGSNSLTVFLTNFTNAPYADNVKTFSNQEAFCTVKIIFPQLTLTSLTQFANPHPTYVTSISLTSIPDTSEFFSELTVLPSAMPSNGSRPYNHPSGIRTELG